MSVGLWCLTVSEVPDRGGDVPGQSRRQQSLVRHPRYRTDPVRTHSRTASPGLTPTRLLPSGLDYVSHEDILPYNSTEQVPIQHELFERFLMYNPAKSERRFRFHSGRSSSAGAHFLSVSCSSSICTQRHPEGLAGEEPPLAGAVRRAQGDHGEHPSHRHPLLHGNEGK